jgi:hypothetical protein
MFLQALFLQALSIRYRETAISLICSLPMYLAASEQSKTTAKRLLLLEQCDPLISLLQARQP